LLLHDLGEDKNELDRGRIARISDIFCIPHVRNLSFNGRLEHQ
jgi:hypothetical protein